LLSESDACKDLKEFQKCQELAQEALNCFRSLGDSKGELEAWRRVLGARLARGDLQAQQAQQLVVDELKLARSQRPGSKALLLLTAAELALIRGQADLALQNALEAQSLFASLNNPAKEAYTLYTVVTHSYLMLQRRPEALEAANRALALAQRSQAKKDEAKSWYAVATARLANASGDAVPAMQKALGLFKEIGDRPSEVNLLHLLAEAHLRTDPAKALGLAREALGGARQLGLGGQETTALDTIVNIAGAAPELFMKTAQEERLSARASGDLGAQITATMLVIGTSSAMGDTAEALRLAKEMAEKLGSAGDDANEARMLLRIADLSKEKTEALAAASRSLWLFEQLRDLDGQAAARRSLDRLYAQGGHPTKAPGRKDAMRMLAKLGCALKDRDSATFLSMLHCLEPFREVLQPEELQATIAKAVGDDPDGCMHFLNEHLQTRPTSTGDRATVQDQQGYYLQTRSAGLAHGPSFRTVTHDYVKDGQAEAFGVLAHQDEESPDGWERELAFQEHFLEATLSHALHHMPVESQRRAPRAIAA